MPGSRSINGGGGKGLSYFNPGVQIGDYTISTPGNVFIRVDSTGGPVLITPHSTPSEGDRLKVLDYGGDAGDNPITIVGLDIISSNFGMREWEYDGSQYVLIASYKNIFYRDPVTDKILTIEEDTLVTNKIRSGHDPNSYAEMTSNGLEVYFQNVLSLVATKNGIIAPNGAIGSMTSVETTSYSEFQNVGTNVDENGVSRGNIKSISGSNKALGNHLETIGSGLHFWNGAPASVMYDGNEGTHSNLLSVNNGDSFVTTFNTSISFGAIRFRTGFSARPVTGLSFEYSTNNQSSWVSYGALSGLSSDEVQILFGDVVANVTDIRATVTSDHSDCHITEIGFYDVIIQTTQNSFETKDKPPGIYVPSNFVFKNEVLDAIVAPGKLNIEFTTDDGISWSVQEDVFDFLARVNNIVSSGIFRLRLTAIGEQRVSEVIASGPSAQLLADGLRAAYSVDGIEAVKMMLSNGKGILQVHNMPTSDPLIEGQFWNDGGTVKVSAG